jgi:hypothetical protein
MNISDNVQPFLQEMREVSERINEIQSYTYEEPERDNIAVAREPNEPDGINLYLSSSETGRLEHIGFQPYETGEFIEHPPNWGRYDQGVAMVPFDPDPEAVRAALRIEEQLANTVHGWTPTEAHAGIVVHTDEIAPGIYLRALFFDPVSGAYDVEWGRPYDSHEEARASRSRMTEFYIKHDLAEHMPILDIVQVVSPEPKLDFSQAHIDDMVAWGHPPDDWSEKDKHRFYQQGIERSKAKREQSQGGDV